MNWFILTFIFLYLVDVNDVFFKHLICDKFDTLETEELRYAKIKQTRLNKEMKNSYEKITGDDFSGEKYDHGQPVEDVVDGGGRERQPELVPVADLYSDVKKLKLLC